MERAVRLPGRCAEVTQYMRECRVLAPSRHRHRQRGKGQNLCDLVRLFVGNLTPAPLCILFLHSDNVKPCIYMLDKFIFLHRKQTSG